MTSTPLVMHSEAALSLVLGAGKLDRRLAVGITETLPLARMATSGPPP